MDVSDLELIRRCRAGVDDEAFTSLVRRWESHVLDVACRLTGNAEDGRDIGQRAFVRVLQKLPQFDGRAEFSTWLYRIVVNLCRDELRSRRSRDRAHEAGVMRRIQNQPSENAPDSAHTRQEIGSLVAAAVEALPMEEREIIILRHYRELNFAQIAEILETPLSTVKSRLLQGLRRLRDDLQRAKVFG